MKNIHKVNFIFTCWFGIRINMDKKNKNEQTANHICHLSVIPEN